MTHSMNEIGAPCRIHESIRFHFMIEHDCQMTKSQITFLRLDSKSAVEGCYKVEHEMELYVNVVILIFGLSSFMITTDRKKRLLKQVLLILLKPVCKGFSMKYVFIPTK